MDNSSAAPVFNPRRVKEEPQPEVTDDYDISSVGSAEPEPCPLPDEIPSNSDPQLPAQPSSILEGLSEIRRLLEQLQQSPAQNESLSKVHMEVVEKLVKVSMENGVLKSEMTTMKEENSAAINNQRLRIQDLEKDNATLKVILEGQNRGESVAKKRKLDETTTTSSDTSAPRGTFSSQVAAIVHACHCKEPNCSVKYCALTKNNVQHALICQKRARGECFFCGQFQALCWYHSEGCSGECPVPFCFKFRKSLKSTIAE